MIPTGVYSTGMTAPETGERARWEKKKRSERDRLPTEDSNQGFYRGYRFGRKTYICPDKRKTRGSPFFQLDSPHSKFHTGRGSAVRFLDKWNPHRQIMDWEPDTNLGRISASRWASQIGSISPVEIYILSLNKIILQ